MRDNEQAVRTVPGMGDEQRVIQTADHRLEADVPGYGRGTKPDRLTRGNRGGEQDKDEESAITVFARKKAGERN